jgi:membrane-bound lytic murein transglycosylase A
LPVLADDLDRESLQQAIHRSLEFLARLPAQQLVGERPRRFTAGEVRESLLSFLNLLSLWEQPERLAEEVRSHFDLYPSAVDPGEREVLFTGYYQPVIEGSLVRTPTYRYPIYRRPDDLVEAVLGAPQPRGERLARRLQGNRLVAYFSRYEIDIVGRLRGKGYEIAWVKDPVELFFLHIQGSGIIRLADGRRLHVNYAASNGRPYTSIGKVLIEKGKVPEAELSLLGLRHYLAEHPEARDKLFAQNERYIFFRFADQGPLGSLEVLLTPGRSIATDLSLFPRGALAFIVSRKPVLDARGKLIGWQPFSRFVLNQDSGSAIRGPRRADLYFGSGDKAGEAAGFMKSAAQIYFLAKKKGAGR